MKYSLPVLLIAGCCAAFLLFLWRHWSPFGHREAFMRGMDSCLQNYASDHDSWFPDAGNPWDALAKLYPRYSDRELAGLTGNIRAVTNALLMGQSISNLTSWVYIPGLREDDEPQLAILWESKQGVSASGRLNFRRTRPVLLLNREITNVTAAEWESFVARQEQLRMALRTNHAARTNKSQ